MRAGVLGLLVVLAACGPAAEGTPDTSPSSSPTAAVSMTASPSSSPSPSVSSPTAVPSEPAAADLEVDAIVEVIVTDLVVRTEPTTAEPPSSILPVRLTSADLAFVVDGPVEADGYAWYLVAPLNRPDGSRGPFGWIAAASREGEPWVRTVALACPAGSNLAAVIALQPLERLACFGDDSLTISAPIVSCGAGGGPWTFIPSWLGEIGGCGLAPDTSGERVLRLRVAPGDSGPSSGPITVSGHFDDPAAATCTVTSADAAFPAPSDEEAVVLCRSEFVLEP